MKHWLFLLLLPISVCAQKNYPALLDAYTRAEYTVNDFNGTVLVMRQGKPVYKKAFGMADMEWQIPNTTSTKYRIGSVTKQFTAACILQLAEQGKLSVDDKLSKYIADYPKGDSITIHMLLNHTSGITNYTNLKEFWPKAILPLSTDSMIALFKHRPLDFSPGTKWSYSNSGYFLLGVIVEKVSGQLFGEYLQEQVINKAGLKNTALDNLDTILQFRAKGYSKNNLGNWQHAMRISMEVPYSAGAMYSTVDDLYTWIKALTGNKIIGAAAVKKMLTPYMNHYGYGIGIDSVKKHLRISHSGGIPGFSAFLSFFPDDDICIAAISNNDGDAGKLCMALASIMYDVPVQKPYIPKEVSIQPAILDKYTGTYTGINTIELVKKDNKLYRRRTGDDDIELKPESNTRFFYADASDRFIEFTLDKKGTITNAWLISGGEKMAIKKQ